METSVSPPAQRLPSLNGWRALSILLVLISHYFFCASFPIGEIAWNRWFEGNFGVRCFFIISGFLITWLLIDERERTGMVNLKYFYIRRGLRILPVYASVLFALWIMHLCHHPYQEAPIWIGLLTFTRNFLGQESTGGSVSIHAWSLSVEEQFYLVWPLTFKLLMDSKSRRTTLYWLLGGVLIISPLCRLLALMGQFPAKLEFIWFGKYSTFLYLDYLAYGCLSAFLLFYERDRLKQWVKRWGPLILIVSGALIIVPYMAKLGNAFQATGVAVLILYTILDHETCFYRFLNLKWISFVGTISYSLYLWQQFSWNLFDYGRFWPLSIIPIFGIGCLSYFVIERPFLKMKKRFRR